jgi:hypothetical protein
MLSFFCCPYSLGSVMCLGVTAGAYVLTLFSVSIATNIFSNYLR